jgi:hypothetical protein
LDAHRDEKRFTVHAEKKANAFVQLEAAIRARQSAQGIPERMDKARQTIAERLKASSITSSDVSPYLRHG